MARNGLHIECWAQSAGQHDGSQRLSVDLGERPIRLAHAPASGAAMASNGRLGVDLIRVAAGYGFRPHTHPGDHVLIVVGGEGTITYDGVIYPTTAGTLYMIDGEVPHAVGAITDHVILAVGSPHRPVDADDRMTPVEYQEVLSELGDLRCLICDLKSTHPRLLHDVGCAHCPCPSCSTGDSHHDHDH